jgi:hypothetical protein
MTGERGGRAEVPQPSGIDGGAVEDLRRDETSSGHGPRHRRLHHQPSSSGQM